MTNEHRRALVIGVVMAVGGLVLALAFHEVETPVVGARQLGVVLAVLGIVELAVTAWAIARERSSAPR